MSFRHDEPGMDDAGTDSSVDLDESLGMLANETRLRIVQALARAADGPRLGHLSYAELQERVDVPDNGRLNYHLGELVDTYVVREDGQYGLRYAGHHVYRTLESGTFDERIEVEPFAIDADCHHCGGSLAGRYTLNQVFHVYCPDCDAAYVATYFPSRGLLGRSEEERLAAVDRRCRHALSLMSDGVCLWCGSRPELSFVPGDEISSPRYSDLKVLATFTCDRCGGFLFTTVGKTLLERTAVISFFDDHGVDLRDVPVWEPAFAATDERTTVRSEDPWRFSVAIALDDEELRLELDGELEITARERVTPR